MKFLMLVVILTSSVVYADSWQVQHNNKLLNASFVDAGSDQHIYLIVHGTWAHQGMEIISSLQTLLEERDVSSLAITLSLGLSDRAGFMSCDKPVHATQDMAVDEIQVWIDTLIEHGFKKITIIGHSRGSGQVALYEKQHPGNVDSLVLLAPSVWRKEAVFTRYNARSDASIEDILTLARSSEAPPLIGPYPLISCDSIMASPQSFLSYYGEGTEKHTPALLQTSTVPVHIILGSEDTIVRWADRDIRAVEKNPRVVIDTVEGAGHFFRDLYLDDVLDLIMADGE